MKSPTMVRIVHGTKGTKGTKGAKSPWYKKSSHLISEHVVDTIIDSFFMSFTCKIKNKSARPIHHLTEERDDHQYFICMWP